MRGWMSNEQEEEDDNENARGVWGTDPQLTDTLLIYSHKLE